MDIEDIVTVYSASRRTDIPCYYMDIVLEMMKNEILPANSCIAWWSKNYNEWIKVYLNNKELFSKYKHYFNFTINSENLLLEPNIPTLDERFDQLKFLIDNFTINSLNCRFDPIVFYKDQRRITHNNLKDFDRIMQEYGKFGIKDVTYSFCIVYSNIKERIKRRGIQILTLDIDKKFEILDELTKISSKYGVVMKTCSANEFIGYNNIQCASCIDINKINKLYGIESIYIKDKSQRKECTCVSSIDIGSYDMKCGNGCLYCYANPC